MWRSRPRGGIPSQHSLPRTGRGRARAGKGTPADGVDRLGRAPRGDAHGPLQASGESNARVPVPRRPELRASALEGLPRAPQGSAGG